MESFVTLIVKAPNQQIEDQTIKCEPTWTIQKLKQHLSEVYPSKPPRHEQKLIYSGQLLNDSVRLKDVLRQYEGQEAHTVHLVCSSKYMNSFPETKPVSQASTPNNVQNTSSTSTSNQSTTANTSREHTVPNISPNMQYFSINSLNTIPMDPNQYAMQLAYMQQAYFQYMAQYMQLAANSYGTANQTRPNTGEAAPHPAEQPPPPPAEAPVPPRDPDIPERDWLEVFYVVTRAAVLFIVIYFYSSPIRFLFVLLLGIGLYLYQIGFFRNMNNNNNNINGPPEQAQEEEAAPSRFMIVWTFFATFFASLIPEIPNAI